MADGGSTGAPVRVVRDGVLTIVTLDRPEARNALTADMHDRLGAIFDDFEADPDQWIAIVTGSGARAFCAGSDLKEIAAGTMTPEMQWPGGYAGLVERFDLQKPVIAAVNGDAMGGGFEIVLACDIVVADEQARFGLPEPRAGVAAVAGGLHRLPRQIGYKSAMAMILTGEKVSAAEGLRLGSSTRSCQRARRWSRSGVGRKRCCRTARWHYARRRTRSVAGWKKQRGPTRCATRMAIPACRRCAVPTITGRGQRRSRRNAALSGGR